MATSASASPPVLFNHRLLRLTVPEDVDFPEGYDFSPDRYCDNGSFGVVWNVMDPRTKRRAAIKKVQDAFDKLGRARAMYREIFLMRAFHHTNVLCLVDVLVDQNQENVKDVYLMSELMATNLNCLRRQVRIPAKIVSYYVYQMMRGLHYLHSGNIIHLDIKSDNMLLSLNGKLLKIADFGLSRVKTAKMPRDAMAIRYRPPEFLLGAESIDYSVDLWGAGCVMGELLGGMPLFRSSDESAMIQEILTTVGSPATPSDAKHLTEQGRDELRLYGQYTKNFGRFEDICRNKGSPSGVHLLLRLLSFNPIDRSQAAIHVRDPYFNDARILFHRSPELCGCPAHPEDQPIEDWDLGMPHPISADWNINLDRWRLAQVKEETFNLITHCRALNGSTREFDFVSPAYTRFKKQQAGRFNHHRACETVMPDGKDLAERWWGVRDRAASTSNAS